MVDAVRLVVERALACPGVVRVEVAGAHAHTRRNGAKKTDGTERFQAIGIAEGAAEVVRRSLSAAEAVGADRLRDGCGFGGRESVPRQKLLSMLRRQLTRARALGRVLGEVHDVVEESCRDRQARIQ